MISSLKQCEEIEDYEIIVVDNHSTDKTAEIAAKFGAKVALETGALKKFVIQEQKIQTELLFFLDADNVKSSTLKHINSTRENVYGVVLGKVR